MQLDAIEFLRRFLQRAPPSRIVRIRHYGFRANRARKETAAVRPLDCVQGPSR